MPEVKLGPAEITQVAGLATQVSGQREPREPGLLAGFSQPLDPGVFTGLDRAGGRLNPGLREINVPEHQQPVIARDVGQDLAPDRQVIRMVHMVHPGAPISRGTQKVSALVHR